MKKIIVGIDLGTTYSSIAYVDDNGVPTLIPNADGELMTPSVALIDGSNIVVGKYAMNQWYTNGDHVVRWIKRAIGDTGYFFQGKSPVEISAMILKSLKTDAEVFLGIPVDEAVITCPAYFTAIEIENTKKAGELAGFRVKEIVKEPTAAAVFYGVENMKNHEIVLVCDLGGGTFDATILHYENGTFIPLATRGDRQLGGYDWTLTLQEIVAERYREKFGADPRNSVAEEGMLFEACETAKRDFSQKKEVAIPVIFKKQTEHITITRDQFERGTESLISQMVSWASEAVAKANLTWKQITTILMVGGSSRLRRMGESLLQVSGKKPIQAPKPDFIVALGAAVLASGQMRVRKTAGGLIESPRGNLVEIDYKRVIARSLGTRVIVFDGNEPRITNSLVIPHGTESPVSITKDDFAISSNNQEYFDVPVVEFETDDEFELHGNYRFTCEQGCKRGDKISVSFNYDISGSITVEATDKKTGRKLKGVLLSYVDPDLEELKKKRFILKPRWVVFAIDTSGSMDGTKLQNAKSALIDHSRQLLTLGGDSYKVGVVKFDSVADIVVPLTSDIAQIERAVRGLSASGSTAMDEGIQVAIDMVGSAPPETNVDIVMVTDGMPDRPDNVLRIAGSLNSQKIMLVMLGIGSQDVDMTFMQKLTPYFLVINKDDDMSDAMTTLLMRLETARQEGLTEY